MFAGVQTAIAIMGLAEKEDEEGPKGGSPVLAKAVVLRPDNPVV